MISVIDVLAQLKVGVSKKIITPEFPFYLSGYAVRVEPATQKFHDLWAKALVIESSSLNKTVIVTTDVLGLTPQIHEEVVNGLARKFNFQKPQIILNSSHTYSGPEDNADFCERLHIERMYISRPVSTGIGSGKGMPDDFRGSNDLMLKCMNLYPGRMVGMFTINQQYQKESLEEIKRCVDLGIVGLKVYYHVKINDPLFYPIIEKMIDLKMITLMHAETTLGTGGYRMKYDAKRMPNTSVPEDFVDITKRYPEAMFQYAHHGGGPDWEYACKVLKNSPNGYVDASGSNNSENLVNFAAKTVGEDRVFFGTIICIFRAWGKFYPLN